MKRACYFACFLNSLALNATPGGFQVVQGTAELAFNDAKTLEIRAAHQTILHWNSFSIDQEEKVVFTLPHPKARILNRVTGNVRSEIFGTLESNGQVYLINSHGIFLSKDACINVNSFVASSFDLLNEHFLSEKNKFIVQEAGAVINLGTIEAKEEVHLIAQKLLQRGSIHAGQIVLSAEGSASIEGTLLSDHVLCIKGENITVGAENIPTQLLCSSFEITAEKDLVMQANMELHGLGEQLSVICAENSLSLKGESTISTFGDLLISSNQDLLIDSVNSPFRITTEVGSLSLSSNEAIIVEGGSIFSGNQLRFIAGGSLHLSSEGFSSHIYSQGDLFIEADTIQISGKVESLRGDLQILTCDFQLDPHSSVLLKEGEGIFRIMVDDCGSLLLSEQTLLQSHSIGVMSLVVNGEIRFDDPKAPCCIQSLGDLDIVADQGIFLQGDEILISTISGNMNIYTQGDFFCSSGILKTKAGNIDIYSLASIHLEHSLISASVPLKGFLHLFAGKDIIFDPKTTVEIQGKECLALFVADHNFPHSTGFGSFLCPKGANIFLDGTGCIRVYTTTPHPETELVNICHEACGIFYPATSALPEDLEEGVVIYYKSGFQ